MIGEDFQSPPAIITTTKELKEETKVPSKEETKIPPKEVTKVPSKEVTKVPSKEETKIPKKEEPQYQITKVIEVQKQQLNY